jgi:Tfp pilus assembly protein FimT
MWIFSTLGFLGIVFAWLLRRRRNRPRRARPRDDHLTIMVSIAVPTTLTVNEAMKLGTAARELERELQTARLKAVQANRTLRVQFNCPSAGQYRRIEVMRSALDSAGDRCSEVVHPFPSPRDSDPATPAHDGPVRYMSEGVQLFAGVQAIEFRPDGRAFQVTTSGIQLITSSGLPVNVSKGTHSATVNVNGLGRVELR